MLILSSGLPACLPASFLPCHLPSIPTLPPPCSSSTFTPTTFRLPLACLFPTLPPSFSTYFATLLFLYLSSSPTTFRLSLAWCNGRQAGRQAGRLAGWSIPIQVRPPVWEESWHIHPTQSASSSIPQPDPT
ncbi:hypothetical protein Pcinc_014065 [Petrolisthes cinctipes]|uniref:Uncharacterized protein n=1 Tax=Petrolisthes cinctipes TaxID=88211 RepID=A0AAE1KTM6_PETCI|nr:hypothetical protein Pcinc_014065 [Petrolisthes cinctipes]